VPLAVLFMVLPSVLPKELPLVLTELPFELTEPLFVLTVPPLVLTVLPDGL
jgi:hypothetical protein